MACPSSTHSAVSRTVVPFISKVNRSPRAEAQAQALSAIATPSEGSLVSFCTSNYKSDSKEELIYENVEPRENCPSREGISEDSIEELHNSFVDSSSKLGQLSLAPVYAEMEDQVNQLGRAVEQMQASVNTQGRSVGVKLLMFPVFRGDECEDAHEFIRNYKRAGRLNSREDNNLALGLPLYLKGHANAWFKTLPMADEMSFEELSEQLITHFASGASEWCARQVLGHSDNWRKNQLQITLIVSQPTVRESICLDLSRRIILCKASYLRSANTLFCNNLRI